MGINALSGWGSISTRMSTVSAVKESAGINALSG